MPTASLLFQRGDVQPARQLVKLDFDEHRLYDSLKEKRWDRVQFFTEGELSPLLPLVHRLRIDKFNAMHTTQAAEIAFQPPAGPIASDTGQLLWEAAEKGAGRLTINAPRAQAALGWIGGQTLRTLDTEFHLTTPFCAVSLTALDGEPLSASKKILLVAAARCANTGMQWNADRTSISDQWGGPPLLIEPVEGQIQLRHAGGLELVPLDGTGQPRAGNQSLLAAHDGTCTIRLAKADATVWYVLRQR